MREGTDATVICTGAILSEALAAADVFAARGKSIRWLAVHTVKPLDEAEVLAAARETGGIISLEEHQIIGGLGSAIAETCMEAGVAPQFFKRMGLNDEYPSVVGDQQYLRAHFKIDCAGLVACLEGLLA